MLPILILILSIRHSQTIACSHGVPILTRSAHSSNVGQYQLNERCLCPNDYYGFNCQYGRKLHCILHSIEHQLKLTHNNNPPNKHNITFNFTTKCFIEQPNQYETQQKKTNESITNYKPQLIGIQKFIKSSKEKSNIYNSRNQEEILSAQFQILYINDTKQFNNNGHISNLPPNTNEQQYLSQYKPYQFQYQYSFIGYLTNNPFYYQTHTLTFTNTQSSIKLVDAKEINTIRLLQLQNIIRQIAHKFNQQDIKQYQFQQEIPNQFQFTEQVDMDLANNGVLRLQLFLYQNQSSKPSLIGLNTAKWKVYLPTNQQHYQEQKYGMMTGVVTFMFISGIVSWLGYMGWKCKKQVDKSSNMVEQQQ